MRSIRASWRNRCFPELCDALRGFRRAVATPVALGERLLNAADFESFLRRGLVDILQPDITNSGGFTYGREIAGVAAAHGAPVAYHNAFGPVQTAATLQMDAVLPTFFLQESFEASWPEWKRSLVRGYSIDSGEFVIPTQPGLGIEVDEKAVERYRSDVIRAHRPRAAVGDRGDLGAATPRPGRDATFGPEAPAQASGRVRGPGRRAFDPLRE